MPDPQPDRRISQRSPVDLRYIPPDDLAIEHKSGSNPQLALWAIFARCKYLAAKRSPREPGKRPDDLRRAAESFRASLESCWRAGYRADEMAAELVRMLRAGDTRPGRICRYCGSSLPD